MKDSIWRLVKPSNTQKFHTDIDFQINLDFTPKMTKFLIADTSESWDIYRYITDISYHIR